MVKEKGIILLIEDKDKEGTAADLLINEGYQVKRVSPGKASLELIDSEESSIELIITEAGSIKQLERKECPPIIILLEPGDKAIFNKASPLQIYSYVLKGTEATILIPTARAAINHYKRCRQNHSEKNILESTQKKLLQLNSELESILDHIPEPIFYKDRENRFIRVNKYIADSYNMNKNELEGVSLFELHSAEEAQKFYADDLKVIESGIPKLNYIESWNTEEGQKWIKTSKIPINDESGECIGILGISIDLTALKRVEFALENSERLYGAIINNISDYIIRYDIDGHHLYGNQATLKAFGLTNEKFIGKTHRELGYPEELCRLWINKIREVYREGKIKLFSYMSSLDGKESHLEVKLCPEVDECDRVVTVIGIARDLTERTKVNRERLMLSTAIEQAEETVIITDTEGNINYVNPAVEQITGYSREEVLNRNPKIFSSGKHDDPFYKELWKTITAGQTWKGRITNKRKDGSFYTEDAVISPVRDVGGNIVNYVAVKRDISKELELEEQYYLSQKMEAIGLLAGGVAHDLNNLLTPILGYSELLLEDPPDEELLNESMTEIINAGQKAKEMVAQLLAFGRKQPLEARITDINQIVLEFQKLLRRTLHEDIEIKCSLADNLPYIKVDRGKLEQVIMNLCVNAQHAMPGGGLLHIETKEAYLDKIYASTHPGVTTGRYVMLSISDTGCGMDSETSDKIFEPFFTTRVKGEGTGLGLSTVYGIIKQHGGNIWVYSELGFGTTFKLYLPYAEGSKDVGKIKLKKKVKKSGTETILLVEDSENVRNLTKNVLIKRGYRVLSAASAYETESVLANNKETIHLLITDVVIPDSNGKKIFNMVSRYFPDIKVLYMSGYSSEVISHHGLIDREINFIQKPFSIEGLTLKVRAVIDGL